MSRGKQFRKTGQATNSFIFLNFLTEKGADAYSKVDEAGKKESWKNRKIAEKVCTDRIVSKNPLVVEIKIKIMWMAVQIDLPEQIRTGLAKFDAVEGNDYTIEVKY